MKKKILLACLVALMSTTPVYSYEGECKGGTIVAGFCISNVTMNWWSAQAWCQVNGSRLATIYEMCPNWDGNGGYCLELKGTGSRNAWSATAIGSDNTVTVELSDGYLRAGSTMGRRNGSGGDNVAVCR